MVTIREYPYYAICFTLDGYVGTKDFDNRYLGIDHFLKVKPEVGLVASFKSRDEVEAFTAWWEDEVKRGEKVFIVDLMFFGTVDKFGITQTSPLVHTVDSEGATHSIAFNAQVLFDVGNLHNTEPTAVDKHIFLDKDTRDNFIKLEGGDVDFDPITYELQVCTAFGTLKGTPPALLYTPDPGFTGFDCFSYVTKDYWSSSELAVVTIEVGSKKIPDFIAMYDVTGPVRISGNFHYSVNYTGDVDTDVWKRGFGGYVDTEDPDNPGTYLPLFIASSDHRMDIRDDVITAIDIIKWGTRTDFAEVGKDGSHLTEFSIASDAGDCQGVIFNGFLENCGITSMPTIDFSKGTHFNDAFRLSKIKSVGIMDLANAIYLNRFFEHCETVKIMGVLSPRALYFEGAFAYSHLLQCIGSLDTSSKVNTTGLFNDTPALQHPDGPARALLLNGAAYLEPSFCGVQAGGITHKSGSTTCEIASIGGSCTSTATYTVTSSAAEGSVHYQWHGNLQGVPPYASIIVGSSTGKDVTVAVAAGKDQRISLRCEITDDHHTTSTGVVSFLHKRTTDYLQLTLPKSYTQINLTDYIKAHNPQNKHTVIIYNKIVNCSVATGSLSGLDVTLINTGELQGFQKGRTNTNVSKNYGLHLTGPLKLINNGWIKGCGGAGGRGGKGADSKYSFYFYNEQYTTNEDCYETPSERFAFVFTHGNGVKETRLFWEGRTRIVQSHGTGWYTMSGWDRYVFRRKTYKKTIQCTYRTKIYSIESRRTDTGTRIGGAGGYGGYGIGYNKGAGNGLAGSPATPADRHLYSGGRGGKGASWGAKGHTGEEGYGNGAAGAVGYNGANAIVGISHLKSGSITGHIAGGKS